MEPEPVCWLENENADDVHCWGRVDDAQPPPTHITSEALQYTRILQIVLNTYTVEVEMVEHLRQCTPPLLDILTLQSGLPHPLEDFSAREFYYYGNGIVQSCDVPKGVTKCFLLLHGKEVGRSWSRSDTSRSESYRPFPFMDPTAASYRPAIRDFTARLVRHTPPLEFTLNKTTGIMQCRDLPPERPTDFFERITVRELWHANEFWFEWS